MASTAPAHEHAAAWAAYNAYNYHSAAYPGYADAYPAWGAGQGVSADGYAPPLPDAAAAAAAAQPPVDTAQPPLPAEEGPPGAASSDTSSQTVSASAPHPATWPAATTTPAAPQEAAAPVSYDQHQYYQQYYQQYPPSTGYPPSQPAAAYPGYSAAYPQASTAAYPQASTAAYPQASTAAYPQASTAAYPQASTAYPGYAAYSQPGSGQGAYAAYPYPAEPYPADPYPADATVQASAGQQASTQNLVSSAPATTPVPGPRPPPGSPPRSANATRQNSSQNVTRQNSSQSYNAVPPPGSLAGNNNHNNNNQYRSNTYGIRPNKPAYASAGAVRSAGAPANPTPAFIRAGPTTVHKPVSSTTTAAQPSGKGSLKFPPTFNTWVERCFSFCRTDSERALMQANLTETIERVKKQNSMWLIDWDKEAIPAVGRGSGTNDSLPSPSSQGGLRSKRSRWEETNSQAQQHQQQWGAQNKINNKNAKKQKQNEKSNQWHRPSPAEASKLAQRGARFGDGGVRARQGSQGWRDDDEMDEGWSSEDDGYSMSKGAAVQGTCTNLEKSYFRLTGPPDPAEVRPPNILKKALDRLVGMLREGHPQATMFYTVDQFKGLRQDCTVQHLRNALAVEVYEAHARQSLEYGDLAEFNQCQTQLAGLYAEGAPGCVAEFTAYKLLYNMTHARSGANKALLESMRVTLAQLSTSSAPSAAASQAPVAGSHAAATPATPSQPADPQGALANALAARTAFASSNHVAFFKAYAAAPNLGRAILDAVASQVRWSCLNVLVKSYKTALPLSFVARALGFIIASQPAQPPAAEVTPQSSIRMAGSRQEVYTGRAAAGATEEEGLEACAAWLRAHGAVVEEGADASLSLDVKSSLGQLFVPEESSKVAHGDENLSVEDFLSRLTK